MIELRWSPVDKSVGKPPAHAVKVNTCWCVLQIKLVDTAIMYQGQVACLSRDWEDVNTHVEGDYAQPVNEI